MKFCVVSDFEHKIISQKQLFSVVKNYGNLGHAVTRSSSGLSSRIYSFLR